MEIQYREFIRKFKKYKGKDLLILGRHSCVIGRWTGRDSLKGKDITLKVCAPKRKGFEVLAEDGVGIKTIFETKIIPPCVKCGKSAVGEFEQYHWDTGEAKSFDLCKKCSKGFTKKI